MSRLVHDYTKDKHVVEAFGGLSVLESVEGQVETLELPSCPFCGGEPMVGLGQIYGHPFVVVECSCCHCRTVSTAPHYNYLTGVQTDIHDAISTAAQRWSKRTEVPA